MFSVWKVTRAAFDASSKFLLLQLRGRGDEGNDADADPDDNAPVYAQLGYAVRPIVARTLRALGVELGDEVGILKLWDRARLPTDLAEGETRVYAAGALGVMLRLLAERAVLEAPEVRLGATAAKKVNREGDPIRPGELSFTASGANITLTYTPPDGGTPVSMVVALTGMVTAASAPGPTSVTLGGKTGPGSNKVRAED